MILQKTREISDDSPASKAMIEMLFYIPLDIDLALHAAPAIALTLDFFLFERKYSQKATYVLAPLVALVYAIWYGWWVERCGARNNGICMCFIACIQSYAHAGTRPVSVPHGQSLQYSFGNLCRSRINCTLVVLDSQ